MRIAVIVPVKNDAVRLEGCLRSIRGNTGIGGSVELIVADNGSVDRSREVALAAGAFVLNLPELKVAALRNAAAQETSAELLAFIDADHVIASTWLASALDAFAGNGVGAVGAAYTAPETGTWVQKAYGVFRGTTRGNGDVEWLGSGNMAIRREAFERVGGFDASLEACEDVDLCGRMRAAGWRVLGDERLRSVHLGDPPTLRALFRAERWRGRNNLRVSFRPPIKVKSVVSAMLPLLSCLCFLAALAGLIAMISGAPWGGAVLGLAAGAAFGLAALRALRATHRWGLATPMTLARVFVVAAVYDAARAVAMIGRASHHRNGPGAGEAAPAR